MPSNILLFPSSSSALRYNAANTYLIALNIGLQTHVQTIVSQHQERL